MSFRVREGGVAGDEGQTHRPPVASRDLNGGRGPQIPHVSHRDAGWSDLSPRFTSIWWWRIEVDRLSHLTLRIWNHPSPMETRLVVPSRRAFASTRRSYKLPRGSALVSTLLCEVR